MLKTPDWGAEVKMFIYFIAGVILVFIIFRKVTEPKMTKIKKEDIPDFMKAHKDYKYVDVRTPGEFNQKKIKGFKNVPLQSLKNKLDLFSERDTIVLICASGSRAMNAARLLSKAGFKNLVLVKGGIGH